MAPAPALAAGAGSVRFEVATTGDCSGLTFSGEAGLPESDGGFALRLRDGDGVSTAGAPVGGDPGGQDVADVRIRVYASPLSSPAGRAGACRAATGDREGFAVASPGGRRRS